ncbi:surp and g-patch domain-containing protein 1-like protein [Plakobranchus ocellatus]|uniref:Surp and g-patch domain-containing protein 1-like protein n=1 Tax=Plakobranchus ocellatus TaxID=259542 RepID=A0AAV4AEN8_9GAST|nr:surp and g-patch domain-containing protein 1-like protein [Plakobranchus ocellatus]
MSKKKDKDFGKAKPLDLNAHEKFLEEKLRQYREKLEAQTKEETTSSIKSTSESNTARLLGKSPGSKPVSNFFSNDGSFLDQFKKMTGQNKGLARKEASSGSKALLQSKVKEESKQSVKLDSLKYHKQPGRAIVLPSFKGISSSTPAAEKETDETKYEVKEEIQESNSSGFGTFNKSQIEKKEKDSSSTDSAFASLEQSSAVQNSSLYETIPPHTTGSNSTPSASDSQPDQAPIDAVLPEIPMPEKLSAPPPPPAAVQTYPSLAGSAPPAQFVYQQAMPEDALNAAGFTSASPLHPSRELIEHQAQQTLHQISQKPPEQFPQQPLHQLQQHLPEQLPQQPLHQLPLQLPEQLSQPPLHQLPQQPLEQLPQPPLQLSLPPPPQQLPLQTAQQIPLQPQLMPQQALQQLQQPPPPLPQQPQQPLQPSQQLVYVSQPAPATALYMTSAVVANPPPGAPNASGLVLQTQVSPAPQPQLLTTQTFATTYPLPQQTVYSTLTQPSNHAQATLYSAPPPSSSSTPSIYSVPPPGPTTSMYGSIPGLAPTNPEMGVGSALPAIPPPTVVARPPDPSAGMYGPAVPPVSAVLTTGAGMYGPSSCIKTEAGMYGPTPVQQDVGMYGPISTQPVLGMYGQVLPKPEASMYGSSAVVKKEPEEEYDPAAPTDDVEGSSNSSSHKRPGIGNSKLLASGGVGLGTATDSPPVCPPADPEMLKVLEQLAVRVMLSGPEEEQEALQQHAGDPNYRFLQDKSSSAYKYFQWKVASLCKRPVKQEAGDADREDEGGDQDPRQPIRKKRRSRWGEQKATIGQPGVVTPTVAPPGVVLPTLAKPGALGMGPSMPGVVTNIQLGGASTIQPQPGASQSALTSGAAGASDMASYARKVIGSDSISPEQLKQIKEQQEMNFMYELVMAQKKMKERALMSEIEGIKVKRKYEYDSDEETEGGTWEHRQRAREMEDTKKWAEKLTSGARGKHFLGDFLPPEELEKFLETFKALKEGREPDYSDYKEFQLTCENMGYQMLVKLGWTEGAGLGAQGQGITKPVNKGNTSVEGRGFGIEKPAELTKEDDEYDAYRKRMMLAYRFRPNPLNNPRRPYY